ncbi:MAG: flavodoxin family protein [Clostridia bacterium]|nr:flavodoxin family protein [Clostridia bacterium]
MKIAILNGSPKVGNTAAMVEAFVEGAKAAGHEVEVLHVGKMKIAGCLACEYCHGKGEGKCIQKDDMEKVMPAYLDADVVVYASPVYYFGMTAQITAAIQRVYAIGKPAKAKKAVLLGIIRVKTAFLFLVDQLSVDLAHRIKIGRFAAGAYDPRSEHAKVCVLGQILPSLDPGPEIRVAQFDGKCVESIFGDFAEQIAQRDQPVMILQPFVQVSADQTDGTVSCQDIVLIGLILGRAVGG